MFTRNKVEILITIKLLRMKTIPGNQRNINVTFKCDEETKASIEAKAKSENKTLSLFVYDLILGQGESNKKVVNGIDEEKKETLLAFKLRYIEEIFIPWVSSKLEGTEINAEFTTGENIIINKEGNLEEYLNKCIEYEWGQWNYRMLIKETKKESLEVE
jgi:hypothetical protein